MMTRTTTLTWMTVLMGFPRYFRPTGAWWEDRRKYYWEGPEQREDRSPENIQACYAFLRSVPYQSIADRDRLTRLETIAVAEARMTLEARTESR